MGVPYRVGRLRVFHRGHGIFRVVYIPVAGLLSGRRQIQRPVAAPLLPLPAAFGKKIRRSAAVEIEGNLLHPAHGPRRLVPPAVAAHGENPDFGFIGLPVLLALQPVVEPAQMNRPDVQHRLLRELQIPQARLRIGRPGMVPRTHEQPLFVAPGRARRHPVVHVHLAPLAVVKPACDVQCRQVNQFKVVLERHLLPVLVVGVALKPRAPICVRAPDHLVDILERSRADQLVEVVRRGHARLMRGQRLERVVLHRAPTGHVQPAELENGELPVHIVLIVHPTHAAGDRSDDRGQVRRTLTRGQPLHGAAVRPAHHADLAVRPGLFRDPLDRVVAVLALIHARLEMAFRIEAPACILKHHRIPPRAEELGSLHHAGRDVVIGRARQDDRVGFRRRRQVDVGRQFHPVAHRHGRVPHKANVVCQNAPLLCWQMCAAGRARGILSPHADTGNAITVQQSE